MNPDADALAAHAYHDEVVKRERVTRQAVLHRAAVERRRKAKRGGKR